MVPAMNAPEPLGSNWAPAMAAAASMDPTDRSMPPVAMTNVIPTATTPTTLAWVRTVRRLSLVRKTPASMMVPAITRATSTNGSVSSCIRWRRRWRGSNPVGSVKGRSSGQGL